MEKNAQVGESAPEKWCDALNWLIQEHHQMRQIISEVARELKQVGIAGESRHPLQILDELENRVDMLVRLEQLHAEREETLLFPLLSPYVELTTGIISLMEHEHEHVRLNLKHYFEKREQITADTDPEDIRTISSYLMNALLLLDEHCAREECDLFPLAEERLSQAEKDRVYQSYVAGRE